MKGGDQRRVMANLTRGGVGEGRGPAEGVSLEVGRLGCNNK